MSDIEPSWMAPCQQCGARPHEQFNAQTREVQWWRFHSKGCTALKPDEPEPPRASAG